MTKITFKGNPVNTGGNLPDAGSPAPDFSLVKTDLSELKLSDLKGKKRSFKHLPEPGHRRLCCFRPQVQPGSRLFEQYNRSLHLGRPAVCRRPFLRRRRIGERGYAFHLSRQYIRRQVRRADDRRPASRIVGPCRGSR